MSDGGHREKAWYESFFGPDYFEIYRDAGIRAALRPRGRFLLETLYRCGLPARFQPDSFEKTSDGAIVLHERDWDLARDVMRDDVTLIRPNGKRTVYTTAVRMRTLRESLSLMQTNGLEPESWYGWLDGSALSLSSHRLVVVARRP